MSEPEVAAFLSCLASERTVSASTQNQALAALLFLYQHVLNRKLGWVDGVTRAKSPERLPVVLTRAEVRALLSRLDGVPVIVCSLLYGSGLRLFEALTLRVKDLDLDKHEIHLRDGKGRKDRRTTMSTKIVPVLRRHLEVVLQQHAADLQQGAGSVPLPDALHRKYPGLPGMAVAMGLPRNSPPP